MKLLSDLQIAAIKAALHDVTDTFCTELILYKFAIDSLDSWQQDRKDEKFVDYELLGQVTNETNATDDFLVETNDGSYARAQISVMLNTEDLAAKGLIVNNAPKFQTERDYFYNKGTKYKVVYVGMEGTFDPLAVLVNIYGQRVIEKSM